LLKSIKLINKTNSVLLKKLNKFIFISLNFKIYHINNNLNAVKIYKQHYIYAHVFFFLHIVWKGKAFRIKFFKKNKKLTFNFGHSHWTKCMYTHNYTISKIKKQFYLIIFKYRQEKKTIIKIFNNIKKFNKYTKRGIRIKQSIYYKRFGKVSQSNSILQTL